MLDKRISILLLMAGSLAAQTFTLEYKGKQVTPATRYSGELGYGFEGTSDRAPYYFSVHAPEEGNYKVTVTFGDAKAASVTTVKAELRRLMVEKVVTEPGKFE